MNVHLTQNWSIQSLRKMLPDDFPLSDSPVIVVRFSQPSLCIYLIVTDNKKNHILTLILKSAGRISSFYPALFPCLLTV